MRRLIRALLAAAVLAPAAGAQSVVKVVHQGAAVKPCPDTIFVSAAEPGATARFVVRNAVDGVVLIAPGVRTIRNDRGGVDLEATTPAQLVVPQRSVQLVVAPLIPEIGIQLDRAGRDDAGRTVFVHAEGGQVALRRDGGTYLQVIADRVTMRDRR